MTDKEAREKVRLTQKVNFPSLCLQLKVFDHLLAEPDHGNLRAFTVILQCKK